MGERAVRLIPRQRRIRRVAILGCGPAGIFAAQAADSLGYDVKLYSKKRRSELYGAQYLHQPIPGLSSNSPQTVKYTLDGDPSDYAYKVYGQMSGVSVSVEKYVGESDAWDIREAYREGYNKFQDRIIDRPDISYFSFGSLGSLGWLLEDKSVAVISSIPAPALCHDTSHKFETRKIWAAGDAPERGVFVHIDIPPMTVRCSGEKSPSWYRVSNVFGHKTVEWPGDIKPMMHDASPVPVNKVVGTNCDCFDGKIHRVGRMGTFTKGVLSHSAYLQTLELLA